MEISYVKMLRRWPYTPTHLSAIRDLVSGLSSDRFIGDFVSRRPSSITALSLVYPQQLKQPLEVTKLGASEEKTKEKPTKVPPRLPPRELPDHGLIPLQGAVNQDYCPVTSAIVEYRCTRPKRGDKRHKLCADSGRLRERSQRPYGDIADLVHRSRHRRNQINCRDRRLVDPNL
jgi:hypothetical protein